LTKEKSFSTSAPVKVFVKCKWILPSVWQNYFFAIEKGNVHRHLIYIGCLLCQKSEKNSLNNGRWQNLDFNYGKNSID
jgi:hypothetical protein